MIILAGGTIGIGLVAVMGYFMGAPFPPAMHVITGGFCLTAGVALAKILADDIH